MLNLSNITWTSSDGRKILDNVSFDAADGKLIVITGPNGGGKTTLARIIAGIEKPDSGKVILDGTDITALDVTQRALSGVSYAFQQPVRFKGITVRQLIETAAGVKLNEGELCRILGNVGLCANMYLEREINSTLSGGEIKRIEIASVLARNTKLMVFDEPEAGIDLWSFKNLINVFKEIHDNACSTIIIISHQERILRIADEIVLLAEGRITEQGRNERMIEKVLRSGSVKPSCCREEKVYCE